MKKLSLGHKCKIFIVLLSTLIFFTANGQKPDSVIAKYGSEYPQERAYFHYDKSTYFPGETIWFRAYLMEGIFPAEKSKTFYVDWIDDKGDVLYHSVSPIVEAGINGQFEIPANYSGNFIHVRGYTQWMLNFDTAFLYSSDIRILSKSSGNKGSRPAVIPTLEFFPEGGELVLGVLNKIAFKASDQWGRPVKVNGLIQNGKGEIVDSFRSIHDGMGSFFLTPQHNIKYHIQWKDATGTIHNSQLPDVQPEGISMQVTQSGNKRFIRLNCSPVAPENLHHLHILGTLNQHFAFKSDAIIKPGETMQKVVPTDALPSGILLITVFNADWNAVAERIIFINNNDYSFQPVLEVQHWGMSKRARNEIQVTIPDTIGIAHFSISVTDGGIEKDSSENIISHLLLSSEIRGYVYKPAWYLLNNSDSVTQGMDLLMLTHGWRRFKWEDLVRNKMPVINYPRDTDYIYLSGKVFGVSKTQLNGTDNIFLMVKGKDSSTRMMILPIGRDGNFGDPSAILFDTLHIYYHLKSKFFTNAEARFMTNRLPPGNYVSASRHFIHTDPLFTDTTGFYRHSYLAAEDVRLNEKQKGKLLETVTVTAKTKSPKQILDEKYAKGLFAGGDSYQFDLVNDPVPGGYPNALYYLQGKVAGLQVNATTQPPSLSWRGSRPQLYVDEVPTDVDMVGTVPVSDIAYIKVFRPPFMGTAGGGSGGAIAIYTRKGNDVKNTSGGGMSGVTIAGYTPIRQFYSPNYSSFDPKYEQPDFRTTLYWNPVISTTVKDHTIHFTFYNNDITKSFRIVIEGMSKDGMLTHLDQIIE